jgi:hypothetical protein
MRTLLLLWRLEIEWYCLCCFLFNDPLETFPVIQKCGPFYYTVLSYVSSFVVFSHQRFSPLSVYGFLVMCEVFHRATNEGNRRRMTLFLEETVSEYGKFCGCSAQ